MNAPLRGRYEVDSDRGCWNWTGARSGDGYGVVQIDKRTYYTHRYMYEQTHGAIPKGFQIDHLCRNRACCNPAHLEAVTNRENVMRGAIGKKTHCNHGHEYTTDNTGYRNRAGGVKHRYCRECNRQASSWTNPKVRARAAVANEVKRGRLTKPTVCSRCDAADRQIQAHHLDYDRPLDIEWLCVPCHRDSYKPEREAA